MTRHRRGGAVAVWALAGLLCIWLTLLLVVDAARGAQAQSHLESIADAMVLSGLRVRAESLARIAARWERLGLSGAAVESEERVSVSGNGAAVQDEAQTLRRALSGYAGRPAAAVTVVARCNPMPGANVVLRNRSGLALGVSPDTLLVDDGAALRAIDGAWYRRSWPGGGSAAQPMSAVEVTAAASVPTTGPGAAWTVQAASAGRLVWMPAAEIPSPNGGFPRDWSDAVLDGTLAPNRAPVYRAALLSGAGSAP